MCNTFHRLFHKEDIQDLPTCIYVCNILSACQRTFSLNIHAHNTYSIYFYAYFTGIKDKSGESMAEAARHMPF